MCIYLRSDAVDATGGGLETFVGQFCHCHKAVVNVAVEHSLADAGVCAAVGLHA